MANCYSLVELPHLRNWVYEVSPQILIASLAKYPAKMWSPDCLEDIDAIRVRGYEVIYYDQAVEIPYPHNANGHNATRPEGRSFHHGRFIQRLREAAKNTPNITVVETTVTDIVKNNWTGQVLGVKSQTKGENDFVGLDIHTPARTQMLTYCSSSTLAISR